MIIVDTGAWVALANRRDKHHDRVREAFARLREPLVVTWPVMTETCHVLLSRLGDAAQRSFIAAGAKGAYEIFELAPAHLPRIEALMAKYRELPMDVADASLVVLAEELGSGRILTTDTRDFGAYRWKQRKPFRNLLPLSAP